MSHYLWRYVAASALAIVCALTMLSPVAASDAEVQAYRHLDRAIRADTWREARAILARIDTGALTDPTLRDAIVYSRRVVELSIALGIPRRAEPTILGVLREIDFGACIASVMADGPFGAPRRAGALLDEAVALRAGLDRFMIDGAYLRRRYGR